MSQIPTETSTYTTTYSQ